MPLNVSVQRSPTCDVKVTPRKVFVTPKKSSPRFRKSIENLDALNMMKELHKNASQINEKLLSPKSSRSNSSSSDNYTSLNSLSESCFTPKKLADDKRSNSTGTFLLRNCPATLLEAETYDEISHESSMSRHVVGTSDITHSQTPSDILSDPLNHIEPIQSSAYLEPQNESFISSRPSTSGITRAISSLNPQKPSQSNSEQNSFKKNHKSTVIKSSKRKKSRNLRIKVLSNLSGIYFFSK